MRDTNNDTYKQLNERGERLNQASEKSENLVVGSSEFNKGAKDLKRQKQEELENNPLYRGSRWFKNLLNKNEE